MGFFSFYSEFTIHTMNLHVFPDFVRIAKTIGRLQANSVHTTWNKKNFR